MLGTHKVFHASSHNEEQKKPWKTMRFSKGDCFKKNFLKACFSSVQQLSRVRLFVTPWTAACQASLSITNSWSPLKPMSIESMRCHPTISFSVVPFSFCPQSFPVSGSFTMSQLLASGGQSLGVSASTSVLPMTTQEWSPLGWTGWISLQSKACLLLTIIFQGSLVLSRNGNFGT